MVMLTKCVLIAVVAFVAARPKQLTDKDVKSLMNQLKSIDANYNNEKGRTLTDTDELDGLIQNYIHKDDKKNTHNQKRSGATPNIIFFLADDLGANDIGYLNTSIVTPIMDNLADNGAILENNYVVPICTPSRMSLMTGKYPYTAGFQHMVLTETNPHCVAQDIKFLPERLKEVGYDTHMLGKWHLGFCKDECTPNHRGFDSFYGFYAGMEDYLTHEVNGFYDWRDDMVEDRSATGKYGPDLLMDRANKIITERVQDNPFFMYFAFPNPHVPLQPKASDQAKYSGPDGDRKDYTALISNMDDIMGSIVDNLKASGQFDNTLIIFSSDNGGELGVASNHPYRGGKGSFWEGGHKAIGFVHGPSILGNNGVPRSGMFHISDWTPTLMHLAGGSVEAGLDGIDQYEMIINGGSTARTEYVINIDSEFPPTLGSSAIRVGDFKLIEGNEGFVDGYSPNLQYFWDYYAYMVSRKKRGSYHFTQEQINNMIAIVQAKAGVTQLYDVINDPLETTDLALTMPDKLAELEAKLTEYKLSYVSPPANAHDDVAAAYPPAGGAWSTGWC